MNQQSKVLPCPFCGGECDATGWLRGDGVRGPECNDCGATTASLEGWNLREGQAEPTADCTAVLIELINELGAENDQLKAQLQQQYHERLVKLVGLLRDISKLTRSQRMDDMVWGVHAARIAVALYQHPEPPHKEGFHDCAVYGSDETGIRVTSEPTQASGE